MAWPFSKKPAEQRAQDFAAHGDKLLAAGNPEKALKQFRKAADLFPNLPGIFDKLIEAKDRIDGEWKMEEFVESVDWAMRKQEQENPSIRHVHAHLGPDWEKASLIAISIMTCEQDEQERDLIEQLVGLGEIGTRALVEVMLQIKKGAHEAAE